jgi:hypothetical protein
MSLRIARADFEAGDARLACARSCASPGDRYVVNVWGVGYRLLE